jgi:zinc/manganese transport system substrate-binding protein
MSFILSFFLISLPIHAKINMVTSTTELAWLAERIGGDRIQVESLLSGKEDPHFVEALPSFVAKVSRADIFCIVGLELEVGWAPKVIEKSNNPKISPGSLGYCEIGKNIKAIEVPKEKLDRSHGDVHSSGNPHFHLSPEHMAQAAEAIYLNLIAIDEAGSIFYKKNLQGLNSELSELKKQLSQKIRQSEKLRNSNFFEYHKEFSYFFFATGLKSSGTIEVVPGVPPSAGQIARSALIAKELKISLALAGPYAPNDVLTRFSEISGTSTLMLPTSLARGENYLDYLPMLLERVLKSL